MPPFSQYQVMHYFTQQLAEALQRAGVECKLVGGEAHSSLIEEILLYFPDCTLSFNGLLPDSEGRFFCDTIQVPHVACLVDSPNHFFSFAQSPYTIITSADRFFCSFFQNMKQTPVAFMPHAVSKDIYAPPEGPRKYECVMLATCIDPNAVYKRWKIKYSPELCKILEKAAERTLEDNSTSYIEAFTLSMEGEIDPTTLNYEELFDELETYIRGRDRLELIKALKGHVQVHVFGGEMEGASWSNLFPKGQLDVIVHDPIGHEEVFQVMKESKIVLNSCPTIKQGAHERIFSGIACGAAVLTSDNPYLREIFNDNEDLLMYQHLHWKDAVPKVQALLKDEKSRCHMVSRAYEKVRADHTWDNRAQLLIDFLPKVLDQLQET